MSWWNRIVGTANPCLVDWRGQRVWIVGASTGIGLATAAALHAAGATVHVSARKADALASFVAAHPGAMAWPLDVAEAAQVRAAADAIFALGPLDMVVLAAGYYKALEATHFDLQEALRHQSVNYVGALNVLDAVLAPMLRAGSGHISLLGSVAGFRGLPLSLGYGPTKAALIHLAEVLYLDLHPKGLGVSIVNPGFVETPLTAQNEFKMPALMTPEQAAQEMLDGWRNGRFEIHYPYRFTWPMKLLALLPFRIYQAIVRRGTGK
ncbi:SDR family NAD(P)-dependent oxidoreductase [Caenimonas koreensis]|uniref:SDR family NAD(P)-dependent oxidoreductase n=1 Tax=Caenimonas koreensis DSM 17982 TaxID=1121255 RepID=A0A844AQB7_9BURK|nr:SDR family NAD(P)-dependent oxidoreductase [Caenimonas koreensis]MRD46345.1 SDR family NAD(P)-dependent oxidoreductase [Caenimonas koreensis DSM 17982]